MKYTNKELFNCLNARLAWYKKALEMATGKQAVENGFSWPDDPQNTANWERWRGCIRELTNTISIIAE